LYLHGVIYLVDEVGVDKEVVKEECYEVGVDKEVDEVEGGEFLN